MKMRVIVFLLAFASLLFAQAGADIENKSKIAFTPHNFVGTQGIVTDEGLLQDFTLCRVCHIPSKMAAVEPLWYRKEVTRDFDIEKHVESERHHLFPADNTSRSCLFCHDGTVAKGFPRKEKSAHEQVSLLEGTPEPVANLHLHLFGFDRDNQESSEPAESSALMLDPNSRITCATCHDPHNNELDNFLRVTNEGSAICMDCHEMKNWNSSTHGNPMDPRFVELKDQACSQCHDIHAIPAQTNLLKADENTLCLSCHDGTRDESGEVAANDDLESIFEKPFSHPIAWNNSDGMQGGFDIWSSGMGVDRAVNCSDCHNPHAASGMSESQFLDGSQILMAGVDNDGFTKDVVDFEYETCYKCHGSNQNANHGNDVGRLFARSNMSFHPVEAPGNNPMVQSLKAEWSEQSLIKCSDCHGNDDPMGAQGPHGSSIPHLLKDAYTDQPFAQPEESELCFQCHEQGRVVLGGGFKFHKLHIDGAGYSCSACHNPHGSMEYPGLMDLNKPFITPVNGVLEIVQTEPGHGYCTLKCHEKSHPSQTY